MTERYLWSYRPLASQIFFLRFVPVASCAHVQWPRVPSGGGGGVFALCHNAAFSWGGGGAVVLVCYSRLQLAAPIGRSPFAALPLAPFPPKAVVPIGLSPPVSFLFLLGLSFPPYFPFLSLGRLCQIRWGTGAVML